jgi:hypothetical protein
MGSVPGRRRIRRRGGASRGHGGDGPAAGQRPVQDDGGGRRDQGGTQRDQRDLPARHATGGDHAGDGRRAAGDGPVRLAGWRYRRRGECRAREGQQSAGDGGQDRDGATEPETGRPHRGVQVPPPVTKLRVHDLSPLFGSGQPLRPLTDRLARPVGTQQRLTYPFRQKGWNYLQGAELR